MEESCLSPIVQENTGFDKDSKSHMTEIIDGIEQQIESMRLHVAQLEDEKEGIVTALDTIRQSVFMESLGEGKINSYDKIDKH